MIPEWQRFEEDLARDLGLQRVPGSGAHWTHKLDVSGRSTRWSLKYTSASGMYISHETFDEAVEATEGLGGTGETPFWAFRLLDEEHDYVLMRKDDFLKLVTEEIKFVRPSRAAERLKNFDMPQLFREV